MSAYDGVILDIANRDAGYRRVVDGGMFALCDSSFALCTYDDLRPGKL